MDLKNLIYIRDQYHELWQNVPKENEQLSDYYWFRYNYCNNLIETKTAAAA